MKSTKDKRGRNGYVTIDLMRYMLVFFASGLVYSMPFSLLNREFSRRQKGEILLFTEMDFFYGDFFFF